jgi:hypothetical protein
MNHSIQTRRKVASILTKVASLVVLLMPIISSSAVFDVPCNVPALLTALQNANANAEQDTVNLASECTYNFTTFSSSDSDGPNALPILSSKIEIYGNNSILQRDPAANAFRILKVATQGEVVLFDLTISGGRTSNATALASANAGGGVYNDGEIEIHRSRITLNKTGDGLVGGSAPFNKGGNGGGIYSSDKLEIYDSSIDQNQTGNSGDNGSGLAGNGAGIYLANLEFNVAVIDRSSVYSNIVGGTPLQPSSPAGFGGGLHVENYAQVFILNSTFFLNESATARGGAINAIGEALINHSTIALNSSGILVSDNKFDLINSILSLNDGADCIANNTPNFITLANNIVHDVGAQACGASDGVNDNIIGDDADLRAPFYRGGPTPTFGLQPTSKAINKGTFGDVIDFDQRNIRRPQPTGQAELDTDVGAYEQESLITNFDSLVGLEIYTDVMDQWIEVDLNNGDKVAFTAAFTHALGDLDVAIYGKNDLTQLLQGASSSTDGEFFEYTASKPGPYWIRVYGFAGATNVFGYSIDYTRNDGVCFPVKTANKVAIICL